MRRWLVVAIVVATCAAGVLAFVLTRTRESSEPASPASDPIVEEFRAVERAAIATFNTALRRQRANEIDELELAQIVDRDVLEPWRAMRSRVNAAAGSGELHVTLRRYVESRQQAWEAYVAALRAPSDESARPHYDRYHAKNAEAQEDAKALGQMFRR